MFSSLEFELNLNQIKVEINIFLLKSNKLFVRKLNKKLYFLGENSQNIITKGY